MKKEYEAPELLLVKLPQCEYYDSQEGDIYEDDDYE